MEGRYSNKEHLRILIAESLSMRGVPFEMNGRSFHGFSCSGLQCYLHRRVDGVKELDFNVSTANPVCGLLAVRRIGKVLASRPDIFRSLDLSEEELQPGDLATFRMDDLGEYHLGTYLGDTEMGPNCFIHSIPRYGVSLSRVDDPLYGKSINEGWRILPND